MALLYVYDQPWQIPDLFCLFCFAVVASCMEMLVDECDKLVANHSSY